MNEFTYRKMASDLATSLALLVASYEVGNDDFLDVAASKSRELMTRYGMGGVIDEAKESLSVRVEEFVEMVEAAKHN